MARGMDDDLTLNLSQQSSTSAINMYSPQKSQEDKRPFDKLQPESVILKQSDESQKKANNRKGNNTTFETMNDIEKELQILNLEQVNVDS